MRFVFALLLLVAFPATALPWSGHVTAVVDGDSIIIEGIEVNFYGVDAPELGQPSGEEARDYLVDRMLGKKVTVVNVDVDSFGRQIGLVYSGTCVNIDLIRQGWAWVSAKTCTRKECESWKRLEEKARRERTGLWENLQLLQPWE